MSANHTPTAFILMEYVQTCVYCNPHIDTRTSTRVNVNAA